MREVLNQSEDRIKLWPAALYGALEQLTNAGFIVELSGSGHHPKGQSERKKYYRLSRTGRDALEEEVGRLERLTRTVRLKLHARPS